MSAFLEIVQLLLGAGAAGAVGFLAGFAFAVEYHELETPGARTGLGTYYWSLLKRGFWLYQFLGWCFLGWLFLEGGAIPEIVGASAGVVGGNLLGLIGKNPRTWIRNTLASGLSLCALGFLTESASRGFPARLLGPIAVGLICSGAVGAVCFAIWTITKLMGRESVSLSFRLPAVASFLFLVAGGPFLWMVLVASIGFGYSCSARYLPPSEAPRSTAVWQGLAALAVAHALFNFYFYGMSAYGLFWHPVLAVAPYALGALLVGVSLHRVGVTQSASIGEDRVVADRELARLRTSLVQAAHSQAMQLGTSKEEAASSIVQSCRVLGKPHDPAAFVDVVLSLLALPTELAFTVALEFSDLAPQLGFQPFGTIMVAVGNIDSLYQGMLARVSILRQSPQLAEVIASRDVRLRRAGSLLAVGLLISADDLADAMAMYRDMSLGQETKLYLDEELRARAPTAADHIIP